MEGIGPIREGWQELCEQAAKERDPERLLALVSEINRLLAEAAARRKPHQASLLGPNKSGTA